MSLRAPPPHGERQHRATAARSLPRIGAARQQHAHRFRVPVADGHPQRCVSSIDPLRAKPRVGATREQPQRRRGLVLVQRVEQRRPEVAVVRLIHPGAALQKGVDRGKATQPAREIERFLRAGLAPGDQSLDLCRVIAHGGAFERRFGLRAARKREERGRQGKEMLASHAASIIQITLHSKATLAALRTSSASSRVRSARAPARAVPCPRGRRSPAAAGSTAPPSHGRRPPLPPAPRRTRP